MRDITRATPSTPLDQTREIVSCAPSSGPLVHSSYRQRTKDMTSLARRYRNARAPPRVQCTNNGGMRIRVVGVLRPPPPTASDVQCILCSVSSQAMSIQIQRTQACPQHMWAAGYPIANGKMGGWNAGEWRGEDEARRSARRLGFLCFVTGRRSQRDHEVRGTPVSDRMLLEHPAR